MTADAAAAVSRALILATPVVWVAWDLYAITRFGRPATESHALWAWSRRWRWFAPAVIVALNLLCWHFFVP